MLNQYVLIELPRFHLFLIYSLATSNCPICRFPIARAPHIAYFKECSTNTFGNLLQIANDLLHDCMPGCGCKRYINIFGSTLLPHKAFVWLDCKLNYSLHLVRFRFEAHREVGRTKYIQLRDAVCRWGQQFGRYGRMDAVDLFREK